jgi:hypothetical protein
MVDFLWWDDVMGTPMDSGFFGNLDMKSTLLKKPTILMHVTIL